LPYVKQVIRGELDASIDELVEQVTKLHKHEGRDRDGMLNYAFTKTMLACYPNTSYKTINECIGLLECCKLEMYRRLAAPYEDNKVIENGDVYNDDIPDWVNQ